MDAELAEVLAARSREAARSLDTGERLLAKPHPESSEWRVLVILNLSKVQRLRDQ